MELEHVALCERMRCSWFDLEGTPEWRRVWGLPAYVAQDWLLVMAAEAELAQEERQRAARAG